jgi:hypothetical protein
VKFQGFLTGFGTERHVGCIWLNGRNGLNGLDGPRQESHKRRSMGGGAWLDSVGFGWTGFDSVGLRESDESDKSDGWVVESRDLRRQYFDWMFIDLFCWC